MKLENKIKNCYKNNARLSKKLRGIKICYTSKRIPCSFQGMEYIEESFTGETIYKARFCNYVQKKYKKK